MVSHVAILVSLRSVRDWVLLPLFSLFNISFPTIFFLLVVLFSSRGRVYYSVHIILQNHTGTFCPFFLFYYSSVSSNQATLKHVVLSLPHMTDTLNFSFVFVS